MPKVTHHAAQRTKERVGIPKHASEKNAERALQMGIRHSDTSGSLNRYITSLYWKNKAANNIRIYCDRVYIFRDNTLITILTLPQKYRKTVEQIRKKAQQSQSAV